MVVERIARRSSSLFWRTRLCLLLSNDRVDSVSVGSNVAS